MNIIIGSKYYKYLEDGQLDVLRLEKIKNQDNHIFKDLNNNKRVLTQKELLSYTKLNPDGYITFSIVSLDNTMADVIVTLHRKKDIDAGDNIPFCTCRQNIFDLFTNTLERNEGVMHIGVSVNKETCPAEVDYKMVLACNSIIEMAVVNIYMDDTLEHVLSYINTLNYDDALKKLSNVMDSNTVKGSCSSLKELLESNEFNNDFYKAFNIHDFPYTIDVNGLTPIQYIYIEGIIKHEILSSLVIKYDRDIDMSKIESKHIILSDDTDTLYIVAYTQGAYLNRAYEKLEDKSDRDLLLSVKS